MGAEFLVAILWGVVVVYWLWTRRPVLGDSIGLFRHELHALEHATPTRVPPANRRRPLPYATDASGFVVADGCGEPVLSTAGPGLAGPGSLPVALAVAALSAQKLKTRRRRRDIISVLLVTVVVSAVATVVTRSMVALSLQALSDLALGAYTYLLVTRTLVTRTKATMTISIEPKAQVAQAEADAAVPARPGEGRPGEGRPEGEWPRGEWLGGERVVDLVGPDRGVASYTPVHARPAMSGSTAPRRRQPPVRRSSDGDEGPAEAYGDFDSYASLALAQAN
jgi:hypothetical protein